MERRVIIFGAGQIGRGFLGDIAHRSGFAVTFVDTAAALVDRLNAAHSYPLVVAGSRLHIRRIAPVRAVHASDVAAIANEMESAVCAFTAVGAGRILSLAPPLAAGLRRVLSRPGRCFNVLVCENLAHGADILAGRVCLEMAECATALRKRVGFVQTVVSRMVIAPAPAEICGDPLAVLAEPYDRLPVAAESFRGAVPDVRAFRPVESICPLEDLKLFLHNLPHAACAYLGFLRGHRLIRDALADPDVRRVVAGVVREMTAVVSSRHSLSQNAVRSYARSILRRFSNPLMDDTIRRVARDPLRKLGPSERISGAISAALSSGIQPASVCLVAAAALCYNDRDDPQASRLQEMIAADGVDAVLRTLCGIEDPGIRATIGLWHERFTYEGRTAQGG